MNIILIIVALLIFGYLLERVLASLNDRRWSDTVPKSLNGVYNNEEYRRAQQYDKANKRLTCASDTLNLGLMLLLLVTGTFGKLDNWAVETAGSETKAMLLFFGVLLVVSELISVPFALYKTFVIEEQFGFNKTSPSLFLTDRIKSYIIGILLLSGLIILFTVLHDFCGVWFWLYIWIFITLMLVFISMFYTSLILPIFNKLRPLEEGILRDRITEYCNKTGFGLSDILVMDGSKRSSHANAFFSGIGGKKKIVLYDTLIQKHSTDELVSIIAHETGHYKMKHTYKGLFMSVMHTGLMLYILSLFLNYSDINLVFGGTYPTLELSLLAFGMLYSPVSMTVSVLMNMLSRKHEFEADAYAVQTGYGTELKEALKKLSAHNLSNLNPHPAYVFFYYSHPPLLQRLNSIDSALKTS